MTTTSADIFYEIQSVVLARDRCLSESSIVEPVRVHAVWTEFLYPARMYLSVYDLRFWKLEKVGIIPLGIIPTF